MGKENKWALITGAVGGIGKELCLQMAKAGFSVAIGVRKADERSAALRDEIVSLGVEADVFAADVAKWDACETMMQQVMARCGRLDVLVNNAGITRDTLVLRMTPEEFEEVLATNLKSSFYLSKLAFQSMMKAKKGRIINISSFVGLHGNIGQANYAAAKAGMIGMTKAMAREFAARGILVNAVAPGFVESPMTDVLEEATKKAFLSHIPLKRFGRAEDIANMVVFLASEQSSYITGQCFSVDGGMSI